MTCGYEVPGMIFS